MSGSGNNLETVFRYLLADAIVRGPGILEDVRAAREFDRLHRDPAVRAIMVAANDERERAALFDIRLATARLEKFVYENRYGEPSNYTKSGPLTKTRSIDHPFSL